MGSALKFAASARIEVKADLKSNVKLDTDGTVAEVYTTFYTKKCKVAEPYKTTSAYLNVKRDRDYAFNMVSDVVEMGLSCGVFQQAGPYYYIMDTFGNRQEGFQGKAKLEASIASDLMLYLKSKLYIYKKIYMPYEFFILFPKIINVLRIEAYHIQSKLMNIAPEKLIEYDLSKMGFTIDKLLTPEEIKEGEKYHEDIVDIENNYVIPESEFKDVLKTEPISIGSPEPIEDGEEQIEMPPLKGLGTFNAFEGA